VAHGSLQKRCAAPRPRSTNGCVQSWAAGRRRCRAWSSRRPLRADLARDLRAIADRRPLLAATVATMLSSAGFAGFVVASPLVGERLAGSAAAGTALLSVLAVVFQLRHREAPQALRAQLFTTAASVKMSAFALGSAAAGALVVHSVTACLLFAASAQALGRGGGAAHHSSRTSAP
jgi:hypothetical protein